MKKIVQICICLIILVTLMPIAAALNDVNNKIIENSNNQIESGFMIGIMHVHHKQTGWGWTEIWQPISILCHGQQGWEFFGPLSVSFTPYDLKGVFGPLYHIHTHFIISGFFFICAKVII